MRGKVEKTGQLSFYRVKREPDVLGRVWLYSV